MTKKGSHVGGKNRAEARAEALFYLEAFSCRAVILFFFGGVIINDVIMA